MSGVRRILNELQIVVDGAKTVGRGEAGYLTIGFHNALSAGNLRASLIEYTRRFPQMEISTVEGTRSRLFDQIQNGAVDIAVVTGAGFRLQSFRWSCGASASSSPCPRIGV